MRIDRSDIKEVLMTEKFQYQLKENKKFTATIGIATILMFHIPMLISLFSLIAFFIWTSKLAIFLSIVFLILGLVGRKIVTIAIWGEYLRWRKEYLDKYKSL